MTHYDKLVKHACAAMKRHPRSPIIMTADNFEILAIGRNARKTAAAMRKCRAQGRVPVVFQKPNDRQTFVY